MLTHMQEEMVLITAFGLLWFGASELPSESPSLHCTIADRGLSSHSCPAGVAGDAAADYEPRGRSRYRPRQRIASGARC